VDLLYFKFVGKIIGMALCNGAYLDATFNLPMYKVILGGQLSLEDLRELDETHHNSLASIRYEVISTTNCYIGHSKMCPCICAFELMEFILI